MQIIDNHRVAMCRLIETVKDDPYRDEETYRRLIMQQANSLTAISQFAIAAPKGPEAVAEWNERYGPRSEAIASEVAKVTSPATPLTPETIAEAAMKNQEVGTLVSAGKKDYKASTVPDEANLMKTDFPE